MYQCEREPNRIDLAVDEREWANRGKANHAESGLFEYFV